MNALFRLPAATRHDPAIDTWINAQSPDLGAMARMWFTQMRQCGADIRELLHDGFPTACVGDVAFGYVNVFSTHMNVGFFHGALLDDPAGLLQGSGKRMRHVKLRPDLPHDAAALRNLIEDAHADARRRLAGEAGARADLALESD
jgi:hypothetical protein